MPSIEKLGSLSYRYDSMDSAIKVLETSNTGPFKIYLAVEGVIGNSLIEQKIQIKDESKRNELLEILISEQRQCADKIKQIARKM